jgi:hypothetical protein
MRLEATDLPGAESKVLGKIRPPRAELQPAMRNALILLALALTALAVVPGHARPPEIQSGAQTHSDAPLSDAERKALLARTIDNQHADDEALQIFERVEHTVIHDHDTSSGAGQDHTVRIIPMGTGSARITLAEHGHPADPAAIHDQLVATERQLAAAADSSNPQTIRDREKVERRKRDRKELVGYVHEAYVFTFVGREMRNGREVVKFRLDPNPNFKPSSLKAEFLLHATATAWVDEKAAQLVRLEAVVTTDVSFLAGIAGKVYHGSRAVIEQSEVEPGVWLPTFFQYDYTYRKFFFTTEVHERIEATHYQRIGNVQQALTAIRHEISTATPPHAQP